MDNIEHAITQAVSEIPDSGVEAPEPIEQDASVEAAEAAPEPVAAVESPEPAKDAVEPPADQDAAPEPVEDKPKNPNQRIPYHRHEEILKNARAKAAEEVKAVQEKYARYETPDTQAALQAIQIAESNPQQFLSILAQNPQYAQLLAPIFAPKKEAAPEPEGDIEPDVDMGNGLRGYSLQAVQKIMEQRAAAVEKRIMERFEPLTKEREQQEIIRGAEAKVAQQIADAESWPGFKDSQVEIAAALKADARLSLDAAYRKVVMPKLAASKDEIRKQVLAEINAKPRAVGIAPAPVKAAPRASGPRDMEDVIREQLTTQGLL
jgi:hypothetical protein